VSELNLNDLKYFYYVAKNRSMAKASRELFLSVPALSNRIKNLENDIGELLLNRSNKELELTPTGEVLFGLADEFNVRLQLIQDWVSKKHEKLTSLKIGISTYTGAGVLKKLYPFFAKKYLKVEIVYDESIENLVESVKHGTIDCLVSTSNQSGKGLEVCVIDSLDYYLFTGENFTPTQEYSLIYPDIKSMGTREEIVGFIQSKGYSPKYLFPIEKEYLNVYFNCENSFDKHLYIVPETFVDNCQIKRKIEILSVYKNVSLNAVYLESNTLLKEIFEELKVESGILN